MAGYLGSVPVPQATQHRETFTATAGQTSFATAGYTPQFIDVYLNGVHLSPADVTATNGSDVVLAACLVNDIVDVVSYTPFEVANQTFTGTTTMDVAAITGVVTANAGVVVDEMTLDGDTLTATDTFTIDAATAITLDSDTGVIDFDDNGVNFGRIENASSDFKFESRVQDKDLVFVGNDGGVGVTALTLDMSDAGTATFNHDVKATGNFDLPNANTFITGAGHNVVQVDSTRTYFYGGSNGVQFRTADNSAENVTISNTGATVFNVQGNNADFIVESDNNENMIKVDGAQNRVAIGHATPQAKLDVMGQGSSATNLSMLIGADEGNSANPARTNNADKSCRIGLPHRENSEEAVAILVCASTAGVNDVTLGGGTGVLNAATVLKFNTAANSTTTTGNTRMAISSSGNVSIGTNTATSVGAGDDTSYIGADGEIQIRRAAGTGRNMMKFRNGGDTPGSITTSASATTYATNSDYRLKENVDYDWDATTRLKQLKPARFNFISDDTNTLVDGFLAHEAQSVVPESITGTKDEVDSDGNAVMQGIDQSKLVPLLVKTIQELEARITALEA